MSGGGHWPGPEHATRIQAVGDEIAAGLDESVVGLIFQAGLAATSVLSRTTDAYAERQLAFVVTTLDRALAEIRSAIFKMASVDPDDETPPAP